ncbi:MAG: hypothetical protein QXS85_03175 [Acidilobaceae archaeon]
MALDKRRVLKGLDESLLATLEEEVLEYEEEVYILVASIARRLSRRIKKCLRGRGRS